MVSLQPILRKYAIIFIALIGLIAYANSFKNNFQFDDGYHILESQKIRDFDNYLTLSHWTAVNNRPLSFFTLGLNFQLNELDVTGYHVFNLMFHVLAAFMAFLLVLEILSLNVFKKNDTVQKYRVLIALSAAFIFIAHPIQTQAVTYIIQRMTVLAGLFYMWAVLLYIRGRKLHLSREGDKSWKPWAFYAGAFAAGGLAVLSKQNAASFPLAFLLVEALFIRNAQRKVDRRFFIVSGTIIVGGILAAIAMYGLPAEYDRISRSQYFLTQLRVLAKYWQLLFLPINQNIDYYWPISTTLFKAPELLGLGLMLGLIAAGVILARKNWLIPAFAIFWFYLTLSIESSIIPIRDVIFEHRLYMAVLGFGFAVSYLVFYFLGKRNANVPVIALSLLTVVYIGASLNRNRVWKDTYTLWSDSVKKSPKRERAWYWLASHYTAVRDREEAFRCYDTSIQCNPLFPLAYNGRANLKKESGDAKGAIEDYDMAIKLDPGYTTAYYNRGIAKASLNKLKEAIQDYDQSIRLGNRMPAVFYNRGNAQRKSRNYESAVEDYNQAIRLDPKYPLAYFNRGLTKAALQNHQEAIVDIDRAIQLDPKNHLFYNGKGVSLLSLGNYQEAIDNFTRSIQINPDFGQAYYNRGYVKQTNLGDSDGACADWTIAAQKGYKAAENYVRTFCKNK